MNKVVYWSTGATTRKFKDQSFFDDFNWHNFECGDLVWLEDYHTEDVNRIVGIFACYPLSITGNLVNSENGIVIRLVKNVHGRILVRRNVENVNQLGSLPHFICQYLA